jgi:hypothetical protein
MTFSREEFEVLKRLVDEHDSSEIYIPGTPTLPSSNKTIACVICKGKKVELVRKTDTEKKTSKLLVKVISEEVTEL